MNDMGDARHADAMRIMFSGPEPLRLDGMRLCAGCEERFVLEGYCAECKRLEAWYAEKEAPARRGATFRALPRLDAGVGEFAVQASQRSGANGLLWIAGVSLGALLSPFLFACMKSAIAWLLAFSR